MPSSNSYVSPIAYKDNNPMVAIRVKGLGGEAELEAYVDSGAGISLIPKTIARKLRLKPAGEISVITGKGKAALKLFKSTLNFLGRDFELIIAGQDLPEQSPIKALLGRDVMDKFKVCFNGRKKELEFME
ncbi:MAG: hypothetical protein QXD44_08305 [Candidatus Nezhaarchaeales archaeon]